MNALVVGRDRLVRALGAISAIAFLSFAVQMRGLIGPAGLVPCGWSMPALWALCLTGVAVSLTAAGGWVPGPALVSAAVLYGVLVTLGDVFMGYQWDILQVEALVLGALVAPWRVRLKDGGAPPVIAVVAIWMLVARLELGSAIAKLASGDATWRSLTALTVHYETQPLPTWIGALLHHAPAWFHVASCVIMFAVQIAAPIAVFVGPRARRVAVLAMLILQMLIALTGNYTFFNLLTVALTLICWDGARPSAARAPSRMLPANAVALALLVVGLLASADRMMRTPLPAPIDATLSVFRELHLANGYGLFATMTTERDEIELEGTRDGTTWQAYVFPHKPGPLDRRPEFVAPHQPRLDWQMWFAALGSPRMSGRWLGPLFQGLLEARPEVLALLEHDPFGGQRPLQVRALRYRYRLAPIGSDAWWTRELKETFVGPVSLR